MKTRVSDFALFGGPREFRETVLVGRPNTGDEPQIAIMSYGYSGAPNNGWDFQSRYVMLDAQSAPTLAWIAATGNGGPGYGTITPPAHS